MYVSVDSFFFVVENHNLTNTQSLSEATQSSWIIQMQFVLWTMDDRGAACQSAGQTIYIYMLGIVWI